MTEIREAQLEWTDEGTAWSPAFDDVYFSNGGLAEAEHVYVAGNRLAQRLAGARHFTLAETGFGTGLNFLATLETWRQFQGPAQRLHYIAIERFPVAANHVRRLGSLWPQLARSSNELAAALPLADHGVHHVTLPGGVELTLLYMDLVESLPLLAGIAGKPVDAWSLDGFAPSKNPQMWIPELFEVMGRETVADGTFATFTVAQAVREGLFANGFSYEKAPGIGKKREILVGQRVREIGSSLV